MTDITQRGPHWIQTFSGGKLFPLDPRPQDFRVIDIAIGAARECRYGNQCLRFYSVAEHSELMRRVAKQRGYSLRDQRACILHDAPEGLGLKDICRPLKHHGDLAAYRLAEDRMMAALAARFDFNWPLPQHIKALDESIGLDERQQNMSEAPAPWQIDFSSTDALGVRLEFWNPDRAFVEFMRGLHECGVIS